MATNVVPTKEQIAVELATLKLLHTKIPEFTAFGDNNWEAAQAAIRVIEQNMDEDEIFAMWDEAACEREDMDFSQAILDAARDTHDWLTGETDESWSKGWE